MEPGLSETSRRRVQHSRRAPCQVDVHGGLHHPRRPRCRRPGLLADASAVALNPRAAVDTERENYYQKSSQDVEEVHRSIAEDRDRHFGAVTDCRFVPKLHETRFRRSCFYAMQFGGYSRRVSCQTKNRLTIN